MKIDQDYLKKLLEACQASEKPTFGIEELKAAGFDYSDPRFEFHMKILADQGFIEADDGSSDLGLTKSADGSFHQWSILPLRLTASGHQFIEALSNKEVWAALLHHRLCPPCAAAFRSNLTSLCLRVTASGVVGIL